MKRFAIALLLAILLAVPAIAQDKGIETIGGTAIGYGIRGPDDGLIWGHAWAGLKLKTFDKGVSLYTAGRYSGVDGEDVGGIGGEGYLVAKLRWQNCYGILGGGWLPNVADGNAGPTYKIGFAYAMSDVFTAIVMLDAVDRGDRHSINLHFGVGLDDLFGILK